MNRNDDGDHQQQQQQQAAAAAASSASEQRRRRRRRRRREHQMIIDKLKSILDAKDDFPARQRDGKIVELARTFLDGLEADVVNMMTQVRSNSVGDGRGLDYKRDTEKEVETALRFFPRALSSRGEYNRLPIQCLLLGFDSNKDSICNLKAVSFIYLFAKLAIELNAFPKEERGGLLTEEGFALKFLLFSSHPSYHEEYHQRDDTVYLQQIIRLRKAKLFNRVDINRYYLVHYLCCDVDFFAMKRFRFLLEWNPTPLLQVDDQGKLPLHFAAKHSSLNGFLTVFEYGIRYYPKKVGINLLFRKSTDANDRKKTPIQIFCKRFPKEKKEVMDAVEKILAKYSNETPMDFEQALLLASTDGFIRFDCVYFLLRRRPDFLRCNNTITTTTVYQKKRFLTSTITSERYRSESTSRRRKRTNYYQRQRTCLAVYDED